MGQRAGNGVRRIGWTGCVALALVLAGPAGTALAQGLDRTASSQSRFESRAAQMRMLDTGRLAQQYSHSARLLPPSAQESETIPPWRGRYAGPWLDEARAAARRHAIPEDLFLRLVQQESGWNTTAVSVKGATGLAQLMPGTAALLGVDIHDPAQNLDGGARYLRMMRDRFGTWRLALAAYNAGPEAVARHGDVPPYAETRGYVTAILGR